jgi:teichuronic acid biosynthesis glycosyltransferase TuaC
MSGAELRILVLANMWPSDERPAFGAFVASQVESLRAADVHVTVDFVDGRTSRLAYARGVLRMLALNLTRDRYDLVHAHGGHCGALALLQRRYPTLVSYVGYDLYGKPAAVGRITWKSGLEARLFRTLAGFSAGTITKSRELEELLPAKLRARNLIVPNGVDRKLFRPVPREEARRRLGWPGSEITVLFAADPGVVRKRFEVARDACAMAQATIPQLVLRLCSGVRHSDVPAWMSAADVLLLPSLAEGSPNVVKEALACNLAVVASDAGDIPELLRGVEPAAVLPRDADAGAFANGLVSVLDGGPRRSNGRELTRHLAAERVAARLVAIYRGLAADGRERRRDPGTAPVGT